MVISRLLGNWNEEADQEQDDTDGNEDDGVLEGAPESAAEGLGAVLGGHLVVLFIPEVGEGHYEQAQDSIQTVEGVVDDLELEQDVVDSIRGGPVFLRSELDIGGGGDQRHIDREQQHGGKEGQNGDEADQGHDQAALLRLLVDEDEGAGDEEQDGQADGVGDPDEGCCYEGHLRVKTAIEAGWGFACWISSGIPQAYTRAWEQEELYVVRESVKPWKQDLGYRLELCCAVTFGVVAGEA